MSVIGLTNLCPAAEFYLVISTIALVVMCLNVFGTNEISCIGNYSCEKQNIYIIFLLKMFYILIWTWILNIICRKLSPLVSWVVALFPFVLFLISFFLLYFKTV